jgi:hypothetical protein
MRTQEFFHSLPSNSTSRPSDEHMEGFKAKERHDVNASRKSSRPFTQNGG